MGSSRITSVRLAPENVIRCRTIAATSPRPRFGSGTTSAAIFFQDTRGVGPGHPTTDRVFEVQMSGFDVNELDLTFFDPGGDDSRDPWISGFTPGVVYTAVLTIEGGV